MPLDGAYKFRYGKKRKRDTRVKITYADGRTKTVPGDFYHKRKRQKKKAERNFTKNKYQREVNKFHRQIDRIERSTENDEWGREMLKTVRKINPNGGGD